MKLISMIDFVLSKSKIGMEVQSISHQNSNRANRFEKIVRYAKFLKQPLKLEMFVPCDEDGYILYKVVCDNINCDSCDCAYEFDLIEQAKEKVLFEGFKFYSSYTDSIYIADEESNLIQFKNNGDVYALDEFLSNSISDLIFYFQKEKINLTLTENAIKQFEL